MSDTKTTEADKVALVFNCNCSGCRQVNSNLHELTYAEQLSFRTNGYFFRRDTMRFFNSRLGAWRYLSHPQAVAGEYDKRQGIAVIVSTKYGYEGAEREYELVRICQFGEINRQTNAKGELDKHATSAQARKALAVATYPTECDCHGCQIERAMR